MNYMMKRKDTAAQEGQIALPVRGAAIGNGWVDPFYQYAGAEFAYGLGLIDMSQRSAFAEQEKQCQSKLNQKQYNVALCFALIDDILDESHGSGASTKASGYDVRVSEASHGASRDYPPGHKVVETYLGGHSLPRNEVGLMSTSVWQDVLVAIHATAATAAHQTYEECTDPPYNALAGKDGLGVVDDVVELLEHPDGVELLFFNGIYDIICNHVGNERFLEKLPWKHNAEWFLEKRYAWFASKDGGVSGYMKEFNNLKFLKVMDAGMCHYVVAIWISLTQISHIAGHMVPLDVPLVAFEMIRTFIHKQSFKSYPQNLDLSKQHDSCPLCPTCYERDSSMMLPSQAAEGSKNKLPNTSSATTTKEQEQQQHVSEKYVWHFAGLAIGSFFTALLLRRRDRRDRSSGYDVELQQLDLDLDGRYEDEPAENSGTKNRIV